MCEVEDRYNGIEKGHDMKVFKMNQMVSHYSGPKIIKSKYFLRHLFRNYLKLRTSPRRLSESHFYNAVQTRSLTTTFVSFIT